MRLPQFMSQPPFGELVGLKIASYLLHRNDLIDFAFVVLLDLLFLDRELAESFLLQLLADQGLLKEGLLALGLHLVGLCSELKLGEFLLILLHDFVDFIDLVGLLVELVVEHLLVGVLLQQSLLDGSNGLDLLRGYSTWILFLDIVKILHLPLSLLTFGLLQLRVHAHPHAVEHRRQFWVLFERGVSSRMAVRFLWLQFQSTHCIYEFLHSFLVVVVVHFFLSLVRVPVHFLKRLALRVRVLDVQSLLHLLDRQWGLLLINQLFLAF